MKINRYKTRLLVCAMISFLGCNDGWLETKPLSIYTPENSYIDAAGFENKIFW